MDEFKYTDEDTKMLSEMLENPREPNADLQAAMRRFFESQSPKKVFYGVGQPTKVVTRCLVDHQPNLLEYKSITYYTPE